MSRCMFPRPNDSEISAVSKSSSGTIRLSNVDFPAPDCPIKLSVVPGKFFVTPEDRYYLLLKQ